MDTQDEKKVNGSLLEQTVNFLKVKKGDAAVAELEKSFGPLIFDQYRMYPVGQLLSLQKQVVSLAFGTESEQGYYLLGRHAFESFSHTLIGATLTNVSSAPLEVLKNIQKIWNSVVNFGERNLREISANNVILEIKNDPRNPLYLQGVIEAGMQAIGAKSSSTRITVQNENDYSIEIHWQ